MIIIIDELIIYLSFGKYKILVKYVQYLAYVKYMEHFVMVVLKCRIHVFFFKKKAPSISYKILQMRLVCTNP